MRCTRDHDQLDHVHSESPIEKRPLLSLLHNVKYLRLHPYPSYSFRLPTPVFHLPPRLPSAPTATQMLYLRVNRKFLLVLPTPTEYQPNPQPLPPLPGTAGNLNVIIADPADLHPFLCGTVDWLIKVARLIFEPLGTSSIYTFTTESLEWWLDREMEPTSWRPVMQGEQLRATIYEFRRGNYAFITLTQMSARHARSMTTNTSAPLATPFRTALLRRH